MTENMNPWENRRQVGLFQALWQTVKMNLIKPEIFYKNLKIKDSFVEPYLYYIILTFIVLILRFGVNFFTKEDTITINYFVYLLVFIFGIFVSTILCHPAVMLLKGQGGFKGTFNVLAYASSASIFKVIPIGGDAISGIWGLLIGIAGYKCIHKMGGGQAVIALLLPCVVIFVIYFVYKSVF